MFGAPKRSLCWHIVSLGVDFGHFGPSVVHEKMVYILTWVRQLVRSQVTDSCERWALRDSTTNSCLEPHAQKGSQRQRRSFNQLKTDVNIARKVIHLIGEEVIHLGVVEVVGFRVDSLPFRLWSDDESGRTGLWS